MSRNKPDHQINGMGGLMAYVFGLSGIINILALTGAFYMLQIYDRALASGSISTQVDFTASVKSVSLSPKWL